MNGLDNCEVLGVSSSDVVIHRIQTDVRLKLSPGALQRVSVRFSTEAEQDSAGRVYLALDRIRGVQDASTLTVHLRLPGDTESGSSAQVVAGTVAMYGLRRATMASAIHPERGLRFVLDVTPFFREVARSLSTLPPDDIVVAILLQRELAPAAAIVIGQLVLFREHYDEPDAVGGRR